jgi:large subunit ribosomal protein L19
MNLIQTIESETLATHQRPLDIRPGDTARVHVRIVEGEKSRIQVFEGTVIRIKKGGPRTTITVRKISSGVGVERVFLTCSPNIDRIDVTARHKVRRAKLTFLRSRRGKSARLKPILDFKRVVEGTKTKKRRRGKKRRQEERRA